MTGWLRAAKLMHATESAALARFCDCWLVVEDPAFEDTRRRHPQFELRHEV